MNQRTSDPWVPSLYESAIMTAVAAKTKTPKLPLDLQTERGMDAYKDINEGDVIVELPASCHDFLTTGKFALKFGDCILFEASDTPFVMKDKIIYPLEDLWNGGLNSSKIQIKSAIDSIENSVPAAVLIGLKKEVKRCKYQQFVLVNGDTSDSGDGPSTSLVDEVNDCPTVSFACLNRFYKEGEAIKRLAAGKLVVVDFTSDERRNLTAKQLETVKCMNRARDKTKFKINPPEAGFTIVGNEWHRSGTVLFQDKERKMCILMGQDEGTYFGVELPKMAKTVNEAFEVLMPKEVIGKPYQRQGEWFMVPVSEDVVPDLKDCAIYNDDGESVILPLDHVDSNHHRINATDVRVGKNGQVYAKNPSVDHDDHSEISADGWQTFYRNTAVRAFSQEGVD